MGACEGNKDASRRAGLSSTSQRRVGFRPKDQPTKFLWKTGGRGGTPQGSRPWELRLLHEKPTSRGPVTFQEGRGGTGFSPFLRQEVGPQTVQGDARLFSLEEVRSVVSPQRRPTNEKTTVRQRATRAARGPFTGDTLLVFPRITGSRLPGRKS